MRPAGSRRERWAAYRTRRYHALLLTATNPPAGRVVLVNGLEAWFDGPGGTQPLTTQHYAPDVVYPRGVDHLVAFNNDPWPQWRFRFPDGTTIEHACVLGRDDGDDGAALAPHRGRRRASMRVRPLLSGRDFHALMRENPGFAFDARCAAGNASWRPYASLPPIAALSNGAYLHEPDWYRRFLYARERERGLDCEEDLASPGTFHFDLARGDAILVLRADDDIAGRRDRRRRARMGRREGAASAAGAARPRRDQLLRAPRRRPHDHRRLSMVRRLGTRHVHVDARPHVDARTLRARAIDPARVERRWSPRACCPTAFPTRARLRNTTRLMPRCGSSWRCTLSWTWQRRPHRSGRASWQRRKRSSMATPAARAFGIRADDDGLLACGVPGVQLTWMDAKVDGRVITPRIGKPVEVQALWFNALAAVGNSLRGEGGARSGELPQPILECAGGLSLRRGRRRSRARSQSTRGVRPNQIFAVGGLPHPLVDDATARAILEVVERELRHAAGLRTLAPADPGYRGHYEGNVADARWRLSPGHRLAVADGRVRRRLAAGARRRRRHPRRRATALRAPLRGTSSPTRARPHRAKSRTAIRRTRRAAARFRRGRSAS